MYSKESILIEVDCLVKVNNYLRFHGFKLENKNGIAEIINCEKTPICREAEEERLKLDNFFFKNKINLR